MVVEKSNQKAFLEMRRLLDSGATYEQIAEQLSLSLKTVNQVLAVWMLHSVGYTDLAAGSMIGLHQTTVGRIRREWTGLKAHTRGRPPDSEKSLGFVNGCYGLRFKVRDEVVARQSCYIQLNNGMRRLQLGGLTDLPRRIRVLSEVRRLPRTKI